MTEITTVYDRFTELAKRAVVAARDAADALGHDHVGTGHLLLGLAQTAGSASEALRAAGLDLGRARAEVERLVREEGAADAAGRGAKALSTLGIDVAEIQRRADEAFGAGAFRYPRPPFSLRLKEVVRLSLEQARELRVERIDTEHLLLGLLAEGEGTAVQALAALDVDGDGVRREVLGRAARQNGDR
jgi:ATP-dependent Clp protease ATP-binding subunit ClpA